MLKPDPSQNCGSPDHNIHRRKFLQGLSAGAISSMSFAGLFGAPAFAEIAKKVQMETVELMMAAGKEFSEEASAAVKKATSDATAATKKATATAK